MKKLVIRATMDMPDDLGLREAILRAAIRFKQLAEERGPSDKWAGVFKDLVGHMSLEVVEQAGEPVGGEQ